MNEHLHPTSETIDEVVESLPAPVREILADLAGAPRATAQTTIALLPFGWRGLLEAHEMIRIASSGPAEGRIEITPYGYDVIEAIGGDHGDDIDMEALEEESAEIRGSLSDERPVLPDR